MPEVVIRNNNVTVQVSQPGTIESVVLSRGPSGVKGNTGDTGPANSLSVGTVTTGAAGSLASAAITGTAPVQALSLTIPRGDQGPKGDKGDPGAGSVDSVNGYLGPDITLAASDVGAAPTSHTHTKSQVTDFAHTHPNTDITGLGTASTKNAPASGDATGTQVVLGSDTRLTNARTPTAHTHVATTDLTATGTKDATTFLRGDNTWAAPAGGGGMLAYKTYEPATNTTYTASSTTSADMDATNLAVTFTAPSSGKVLVRLSAYASSTQGILIWSLRSAGTRIGSEVRATGSGDNVGGPRMTAIVVTGLTSGASYTFRWGHRVGAAGNTAYTIAGLNDGTTTNMGPATMEVWSA